MISLENLMSYILSNYLFHLKVSNTTGITLLILILKYRNIIVSTIKNYTIKIFKGFSNITVLYLEFTDKRYLYKDMEYSFIIVVLYHKFYLPKLKLNSINLFHVINYVSFFQLLILWKHEKIILVKNFN